MSFTDYEELKVEIEEWSHRDDLDLKLDSFIDLAEAEMFSNQIEPLELRDQETRATASMDSATPSRYLALPDGYTSMRKLRVQITNGESIELKYRTPGQLNVLSADGLPRFYTVTNQLEFDREPDDDYTVEMQYYKLFTVLSTANTTNIVLTDNPNIYLFGSLWALKLYVDMPQEAEMYYLKFINAIRGANNKDKLGRYGPAPVMRIEGSTP